MGRQGPTGQDQGSTFFVAVVWTFGRNGAMVVGQLSDDGVDPSEIRSNRFTTMTLRAGAEGEKHDGASIGHQIDIASRPILLNLEPLG
jgi:hypothetical protein